MSDPFSVPCVATPAVKMNSSNVSVKRVRSRELRGGRLFYTCRCNTRNGLQLDCPLAECQIACSKDRSKCPYRSTQQAAAGDYKRVTDNAPMTNYQQTMQQESQVMSQPQVMSSIGQDGETTDPFGVQEAFLQDGQTVVQMKDGTPMNLSEADVAYIDYGYQMPQASQQPLTNTAGAATSRPASQKSTKSAVSSSQKTSNATPVAATGWPVPMGSYMMPPYMMQPGQFAYPQQMPYGLQTMPVPAMPAGVRPSTSSSSTEKGTEACQPQMMMPPMGQPGGFNPMYGMMPSYYPGMGQQSSWPSYPLAEVDAGAMTAMQPEVVTQQQQQIECGQIEEGK